MSAPLENKCMVAPNSLSVSTIQEDMSVVVNQVTLEMGETVAVSKNNDTSHLLPFHPRNITETERNTVVCTSAA